MKERRRGGEGGRLGATEAGTEKRDEGLNRLRIKKKDTALQSERQTIKNHLDKNGLLL